jgi:hypothetical protein
MTKNQKYSQKIQNIVKNSIIYSYKMPTNHRSIHKIHIKIRIIAINV